MTRAVVSESCVMYGRKIASCVVHGPVVATCMRGLDVGAPYLEGVRRKLWTLNRQPYAWVRRAWVPVHGDMLGSTLVKGGL